MPAGGKSWRLDYRFDEKRRTMTFGRYPEVCLVDAREKRDAARKQLSDGIDPGADVEAPPPPATFESVARAWHALNKPRWKPSHAESVISQLEQDVFPVLGSKVIGTINAPLWRIPKARMKGELGAQFEHWVPLSAQAVATAMSVPRKGALLFPNRRLPVVPMTGEAFSALLARAGYRGRHVPHGWRSTVSTLMNHVVERQGRIEDRAIIDLMLAHTPRSGVEHLYNRYAYMDRRREIAQAWADPFLPMTG